MLPKKVDAEVDKTIYICSMPLAKCNLVKRTDGNNIKYDYLNIANIIKNVVKGFETLRIRGFYHNDLSLGNILKMSDITPGSGYRLSDFGAMRQIESEDEGRKRISQDIKCLLEMLNGASFSRGNPKDASLEQRGAAKSFKEFCKYIKGKTEISAVDVLNHPYIAIYGSGR